MQGGPRQRVNADEGLPQPTFVGGQSWVLRAREILPAPAKRALPNARHVPQSAVHQPRTKERTRIPIAAELAIDEQRSSIEFAISLLYCLHSALRRQIEDAGHIEPAPVAQAARSADLTDISGMLLVRLAEIHAALDPTELEDAKVDSEAVRLTQKARELGASAESGG